MKIKESELILNQDGSVFHLHLKPGQVANTVITVGDSERVEEITKHFDQIEFTVQNREFKTQTGLYKNKRITVISTGIGPDNIDIVLNELDAVVNIDLKLRLVKEELTSLEIIRVGTSGSISENVPLDSFVLSKMAIGFDNMVYFYKNEVDVETEAINSFIKHTNWFPKKSTPYIVEADNNLVERFTTNKVIMGITATNVGFYGPQGRVLRLQMQDSNLNKKLATFQYKFLNITNMEMETSAIYALSGLLGHKALSLNAIIANRATGEFSKNPGKVVEDLIQYTLEHIIL